MADDKEEPQAGAQAEGGVRLRVVTNVKICYLFVGTVGRRARTNARL